jgi:predicted permease
MWSDLRNAIRALSAAPGFTVTALTVLALGIGASTAIFSVVDAIVLRGLPFADANRIVSVSEIDKARAGLAGRSSAPQNFLDWRAQQDVFDAIGASFGSGGFTIRGDGPPEDLRALRTTANLFSILRVRPAIGQPYSEANEVDGNHRVMLISDALWRRRFNADPDVVGKTLTFDSGTWQVLGVMPPEFRYPIGPARATDLWVPYVPAERDKVRGPGRSYYLNVVARLKPGVTLEQARARMEQITAGLATAHPAWFTDRGIATVTLHDYIVGANIKSWMLMLLGAVGFVLLIACVNVANLMLARASVRGRDVSIRAALGASRWQLAKASSCRVRGRSPAWRSRTGRSKCSVPRCRRRCRGSPSSPSTFACSRLRRSCRSSPRCCSASYRRCRHRARRCRRRSARAADRAPRAGCGSSCALCSWLPRWPSRSYSSLAPACSWPASRA